MPSTRLFVGLAKTFLAIAVFSSVIFWTLYIVNEQLRLQLGARIRATPEAVVVNGLRVTLRGTELLEMPNTIGQRDNPAATAALLLVTADDCAFCQTLLPSWRELVKTFPFQERDELIIASFNGESIVRQLADIANRRGVRVRPLRIRYQQLFTLSTGLTSTPSTVILDHAQRVRFVVNSLNDHANNVLLGVWSGLDRGPSTLLSSRVTSRQ